LEASPKRQKIIITGRVQGVGFRPAVYRIARSLGLTGLVYNDTRGVTIELQGREEEIAEFLARLIGDPAGRRPLRDLRDLQSGSDKPPLAEIKSCDTVEMPAVKGETKFVILPSDSAGPVLSEVTADAATCGDCLAEMADKDDFRYGYPFINCTNCGPRYSIVKTIPYDRPNTTMSAFEMCENCARQYGDAADRRFHAQPVACGACGPKIWLTDSGGRTIESGTERVIAEAANLLRSGKIVAIKGVCGFHLAVDALNDQAVRRLRQRKRRDHKPFAMMADSVETIRKYAVVSEKAEQALRSPQAPIVLLPRRGEACVDAAVAGGVSTLGFMLCYAPLHHLLFAQGISILVMTSGNISDEPLICKNEIALEKLGCVADAFLMHDREIYRQVDDSVIHFVEQQPALLRRARGYVPTPIITAQSSRDDIFAAGADLKNTFCFAKQNQLICSEHIGDLEDAEVYHHYISSIEHLRRLFEVEPKIAVCDLHPGYLSTQYALSLTGLEIMEVQHHWAHVASVLAEHGIPGPVIGLVCDGTGYGTDGAIWGCECMIASLERFERFGHLAYYDLPGADKASKEAIRPALGLLKKTCGDDFRMDELGWLIERIEADRGEKSEIENRKAKIVLQQLEKGVNTVKTSSLGRVFDAVAAMIGLGNYNYFDAQLPMALEAIIEAGVEEHYGFELISETDAPLQLDLSKMIRELIADVQNGVAGGVISAKFHNCLAAALTDMAKAARESCKSRKSRKGYLAVGRLPAGSLSRLDTVALSGGVFCNQYLINRLIGLLKKAGFRVLFNWIVPSNDGGISLGQAAIAANLPI